MSHHTSSLSFGSRLPRAVEPVQSRLADRRPTEREAPALTARVYCRNFAHEGQGGNLAPTVQRLPAGRKGKNIFVGGMKRITFAANDNLMNTIIRNPSTQTIHHTFRPITIIERDDGKQKQTLED